MYGVGETRIENTKYTVELAKTGSLSAKLTTRSTGMQPQPSQQLAYDNPDDHPVANITSTQITPPISRNPSLGTQHRQPPLSDTNLTFPNKGLLSPGLPEG
ncbi:hypothetical protein E2C01_005813 [Portunus trituberculatus]|uniref:Uncharacterized protein n=1 Tax=Portunus trituberculatus TaxID=210409 RepID=A0A5B7D051_PORTR|nr:hypothetical protein [Portunus trituberculatus]